MSNNGQNNNPEQQSLENVKKASRPTVRKGANAAAKTAAKASKAVLKALVSLVKTLLPYTFIIIGVLLILWITFNILFEWRGTEKEYHQREENPMEYVESEGVYRANEGEITDKNKIIRDFYQYFGKVSIWKLSEGDKSEFIDRDSEEYANKIDYYEKEELYALNNHMLISLDDFLYGENIRNPNQFIQPVNYDPETLSLKPISDGSGNIIVGSDAIDLETGEKTGETIRSVRDYGLGSILIYNEKEEYTRTLKIIGEYNSEDYWNETTGKVDQQSINEPIDGLVLDGYPESIDLIDKVITFAGEAEYQYEYQDVEVSGMEPGGTFKENTPFRKVYYGSHTEKVNCKKVGTGTFSPTTGDEITVEKCDEEVYDLYKYRSEETKLYEYVPVEVGVTTTEDSSDYFNDYVLNFESYVHSDNIGEDKLFDMINYDSFAFEDDVSIDGNTPFEVGSEINSYKYQETLRYIETIEKYAKLFGIDPRIIVAMIAQESGGNTNIKRGLAQITYTSNEKTKDAKAKDIDGNVISIKVEKNQVNDPETAIKYMVIRFAELLEKYEGNSLKAMQAYNFGPDTMNKAKEISGAAWDTKYGWIVSLEKARRKQAPNTKSASYKCMVNPGYGFTTSKWGDSCYIYNVLQYYNGDQLKAPKTIAERLLGKISSVIKDMFPVSEEPKLGKHIDFVPLIHETIPSDIIMTTTAFNNEALFSDYDELTALNFYNIGFFKSATSSYRTFDEVANMTPGGRGFIWPAPDYATRISSPYGWRKRPNYGNDQLHTGIDIPLATGKPVFAAGDGEIIYADWLGSYGIIVFIDHGKGITTRYGHNSALNVKVGDKVKQGDAIAFAGSTGNSTGPHIHFEIRENGVAVDPISWITNRGL